MDLMDYLRSELPPLVIVLVSTLVTLLVFGLTIAALFGLRGRALPPVAKVAWAALIVVMPFMGALAFFIVQPQPEAPDA